MIEMKFYKLEEGYLLEVDHSNWPGPVQLGDMTVRGVRVSTVFLGMEHHGGMFETMIFGGPLDGELHRCHTLAEAQEQHCKIVDALKAPNWLEWHLDGNVAAKIRGSLVSKPG
jgi:hypothetical protein